MKERAMPMLTILVQREVLFARHACAVMSDKLCVALVLIETPVASLLDYHYLSNDAHTHDYTLIWRIKIYSLVFKSSIC